MKRPARRIGDFIEILSGFAFDSEYFSDSGTLPVVRIRDVVRGNSSTYYAGSFDTRYLVRDGDILIGMDGEFNRARWFGGEALLNQRVSRIKSASRELDERYLFHMLPRALSEIEQATSFVTVKHLSVKQIRDIAIPLPPASEQRRMAEILDKADALRAKRCAALAQLDTLTQSIFLDMFGAGLHDPRGFPVSDVGSVCEKVTDGEHLTPIRTLKGIKLLSARNIRDGYIDFENVDYIPVSEYERIRRRCDPSQGDVLISCSGTIGRVACVETNEPFSLVRSAAMVRPRKSQMAPRFLEHYLRTPSMKALMIRSANASSQANLFQAQIRALPVVVPPLDLQDRFVDRIACVDSLRKTARHSLMMFDALFSSLQHRAFRGEL